MLRLKLESNGLAIPSQGIILASVAVLVTILLGLWITLQLNGSRYEQLVVLGLGLVLASMLPSWHRTVHFLMLYIVVEGFVLNYFYDLAALNLFKDLVIGLLFLALTFRLLPQRESVFPTSPAVISFFVFSLIYVVEIFNPSLPNMMVGLVGVRTCIFYALLIPIGYHFFSSSEQAVRLFVFLLWLSIPVSLFGIFQYFSGPQSMVSLSPGFARTVFYAVGHPGSRDPYFRTFSTFVQTGSFSIYLWFMMLCSIALWKSGALRPRFLAPLALALQFFAMLTTGGRSGFVFFLMSLVFLAAFQRRINRLVPVAFGLVILFFIAGTTFDPAIADRFSTIVDFNYVKERNLPLASGWMQEAMSTDPVGLGAGFASVAARHVGATPLNASVVENTLAKIRFEAGIGGLALYGVFLIFLIWECVRYPRRVNNPEISWLASACAAFVLASLLFLPIGTPFDTSPSNTYLWFFFGFVLKAPQLARSDAGVRVGVETLR